MQRASVLIVDAWARGPGRRLSTVDVIGAGPRTVAGVLEKLGVDYVIAPLEVLAKRPRLLKSGFSALLFSGMSSDTASAKRVVAAWKKAGLSKPAVAGGPIAVELNELLNAGYDVAVFGEAERTLEELARETDLFSGKVDAEGLERVRGLAFKKNGKVVFTGPRPPLSSDELKEYKPSARAVRFYPGFWASRIYVEVVRGCSNVRVPWHYVRALGARPYPGCAYCSVASVWGPARSVPEERVVEDVKALVEEGARRIILGGSDFLDYGRERAAGLKFLSDPRNPPPNLDALKSLMRRLYSIPEVSSGEVALLVENVKPSTVNEETAKLLGYYFRETPVSVGVESGDDELLAKVGRPFTVSETLRALRLLKENGLRLHVYLIYGLPGQTRESVEKTLALIEAMKELGVEKITLYRFRPLPHTVLEGCAPGDPEDPANKLLIEKVKEFNERAKEALVGSKLVAIVAAKVGGHYVAYPVKHGPVIKIDALRAQAQRRKDLVGRKVKVVVEQAISDRVVVGKVVTVGRSVRKESFWERLGKQAKTPALGPSASRRRR